MHLCASVVEVVHTSTNKFPFWRFRPPISMPHSLQKLKVRPLPGAAFFCWAALLRLIASPTDYTVLADLIGFFALIF